MTEDDTFRVLKRIPLLEMIEIYEAIQHQSTPLYIAANATFEMYAMRLRSLEVHILRDKALTDNGWTIEEFFAAVEKQAIIEEIKKLNASIMFPQDIIDRTKAIFPNMVFHQAEIKLE